VDSPAAGGLAVAALAAVAVEAGKIQAINKKTVQ